MLRPQFRKNTPAHRIWSSSWSLWRVPRGNRRRAAKDLSSPVTDTETVSFLVQRPPALALLHPRYLGYSFPPSPDASSYAPSYSYRRGTAAMASQQPNRMTSRMGSTDEEKGLMHARILQASGTRVAATARRHSTPPHDATRPAHATPRHATPCHTTPRHTSPHHTTSHHITPHHTTPHHTTPHLRYS
jgi:hypothetical protein